MRSSHATLCRTLRSLSLFLLLLSSPVFAAGESRWFTDADGVAIGGYDPVAYPTEDRAVRGHARWSEQYDGATFYFSSEQNRELFRQAPAASVPAFGGYCAFGMGAKNARVPADPRTFEIYNGHLLLFFNDFYQGDPVNTKILWNQNEEELFAQAAAHWKAMQ